MKIYIFLLLQIPVWLYANMVSPVLQDGILGANPFISNEVDILEEYIHITIDSDFQSATFEIEYHVQAHSSGNQIPMLFYAADYRDDFQIWIDGEEISLLQLPAEYRELENKQLSALAYLFDDEDTVSISLSEEIISMQLFYSEQDLKYFESDFPAGTHTIRVKYQAEPEIFSGSWMKEYRIRYALGPAKYWNSFGKLHLSIDASSVNKKLQINLKEPDQGDLQQKSSWTFSTLPTDMLEISYLPSPGPVASFLILLSPLGVMLIVSLILTRLHVHFIKSHRKKSPHKKFSWVMILGSCLVPFLFLLAYPLSYHLIKLVIGEEASLDSPYSYFILGLYPAFFPIYWFLMWRIDKVFARKYREL